VTDDNPVNIQVAIFLLRKLGYKADRASNGLESVRAHSENPYVSKPMKIDDLREALEEAIEVGSKSIGLPLTLSIARLLLVPFPAWLLYPHFWGRFFADGLGSDLADYGNR
jgi:hypothetical protein